ncbi:MAG TPA: hypothetical protein VNK43_09665 [Gemmatimonadales bacterium]|nr:hypothetical protein [Gemmatimonadales bacterium]
MRPVGLAVGLLAGLAPAAPAQGFDQWVERSFEATPEPARATVGDTVTLAFRLRLQERDLLTDTVPRPIGPLPDGVRVLRVEKLVRGEDRIFRGRALLAFYRPGAQPVPNFGLPYLQIVLGIRGTVVSEPATVEITPVLAAGNPSLRDIRDLVRAPPPLRWPWIVAAVALLAALAQVVRRRRGAKPVTPQSEPRPAVTEPAGPYERALERLDAIERAGWTSAGAVDRYVESVVNVLRDYLEEAEAVPARERTTAELLRSLPPHLRNGARDRCHSFFRRADRVKFAGARPDLATASRFLDEARRLLADWRAAREGGSQDAPVR